MSAATEIRIISANGMREVIADTRSEYETASGHRLTPTVVETGQIRRRVMAGESFDVIMVPKDAADQFQQAGRIMPGSTVALIRIDFGLAVSADRPPPDVSTPDGLRRTFLDARSILITDPKAGGVSGVHLMDVLDRLGIAEAIADRLVSQPGSALHAARVVRGEADLAVQAEHEIRAVPGAVFLPYPAEFARTMLFTGGIGAACSDPAAARDYLAFMTGPEPAKAYAAHHLTRG